MEIACTVRRELLFPSPLAKFREHRYARARRRVNLKNYIPQISSANENPLAWMTLTIDDDRSLRCDVTPGQFYSEIVTESREQRIDILQHFFTLRVVCIFLN